MDTPEGDGDESGFEMSFAPSGPLEEVPGQPKPLSEEYPTGNSSAAGAVANFVNTIVGAGIVGIPFALSQSGLWAGIFMLCLAAVLNYTSTTMLIAAGEKIGRLNYEELMAASFGSAGTHAFTLFAGVLAFGAMSAYLVIVGDTIPEILLASGTTNGPLTDRETVIGIVSIFCVLPLSLLRDLSKLAYTSCVSVFADVLLTIIVLATASGEASEKPDIDLSERYVFIRPTIFAGFGAISFAFVCQHSSFLVYRSMSERSVGRWASVSKWSVSIALAMTLVLGLGGYLNFVNETEGNILNSFSTEHRPASVARGFLAVSDSVLRETRPLRPAISAIFPHRLPLTTPWGCLLILKLMRPTLPPGFDLPPDPAVEAQLSPARLPGSLHRACTAWNGQCPFQSMKEQNIRVTDIPGNADIELTTVGLGDVVGVEVDGTANNGNITSSDRVADRDERYPPGNSSAGGAIANFVNTIVGAGIVGLPFALRESGLWAGICMLCLAAFLTNRATNMLIVVGEKSGRLNYEELMAEAFGKMGLYVYSFFVVLLTFGAMSAYLIIVADTIPSVAEATGVSKGPFVDRHAVIFLFGIFAALPLSLLKDLSKLSYTSGASVMADVLLTLIVLFAGTSEASDNPEIDRSERYVFIRSSIFAGFGAISFAFVCQSSSFLVYRSMAKGGVDRWAFVTRWSVAIALIMGLALALGGYLNFVNLTEGNILNNFPMDYAPAIAARTFLAITMVFTYPMEMYVARHVLDVSVFQTYLGRGPITQTRHFGITLVLWTLTITLASSTKNLGSILEIFGAFGASVVGYVMPAMLFMRYNRAEWRRAESVWNGGSPEYEPSLQKRLRAMRNFYVPIFMVVFGVVAMVAGVATAVVSELSPTKA